jgi:hypothetical protein
MARAFGVVTGGERRMAVSGDGMRLRRSDRR